MAPQHGSKVPAKCTTWCIHVAKWAKSRQNGFKMGTIVPFKHHQRSCLQKHVNDPLVTHFDHKMAHLKGFWNTKGANMPQNVLLTGLFHLFVHPQWATVTFGKSHF